MYFDNELTTEQAQQSVQTNLPAIISSGRGEVSKHYKIFNPMLKVTAKKDGRYTIASTEVYGIPRHPSQFYEAITYFLLFGLLLWLYNIRKERTPAGQLFGVFMIVCFGFRFMVEFLKENQVDFEGNLALNMGQLLSIPAILAGVVAVVISLRAKTKA
jgi:prolipoprotein diacylglyceryltransferase